MRFLSRIALAASIALTSSWSIAYSGGVTTYSTPPASPSNVERASKSTAIVGPERDATYQRTMRTAQTSAAAARAAQGLFKSLAVIGSVITLVTFAKDLAGIWAKDEKGENVLLRPDPKICSVGPCFEYNAMDAPRPDYAWTSTAEGACSVVAKYYDTRFPGYGYTFIRLNSYNQCLIGYSGGQFGQAIATREVPAKVAQPLPVNYDDMVNELAKSPRLPQLLDDLDKLGTPVQFPEPEVEDMPQPIPLAPITKTNPDGSKSVEQTTLTPERGPDGKTVNWKRNTKVTEYSAPDADGNRTKRETNTDTDTGPAKPEKPPETPATDTPLPAQPKLYEQKYPKGITGVWQASRDTLATSPLFTVARQLMPTVAQSGSCPSMPVNFAFSSWANFGVKDVAPPCFVWDWGRVICIVSACLVARRLIFGG